MNLPTRAEVWQHIHNHPGECSKEIALHFHKRASERNIYRLLSDLTQNGVVQVSGDDADKRLRRYSTAYAQ